MELQDFELLGCGFPGCGFPGCGFLVEWFFICCGEIPQSILAGLVAAIFDRLNMAAIFDRLNMAAIFDRLNMAAIFDRFMIPVRYTDGIEVCFSVSIS